MTDERIAELYKIINTPIRVADEIIHSHESVIYDLAKKVETQREAMAELIEWLASKRNSNERA
ncbi:hypothetical protein LCGC14_0264480 [marine sediment metagenome]|uniref:Uncharacterized protein n=1 Tax=marine sediment metagenome TaxID=412755 RepID=A0A0F9WLH9_9ZZZZ